MALIKRNVSFTFLLIIVALFGVVIGGGTVHKVGDSKGWTMMGADYEAWASSRTFQVGDSLVFEYNFDDHDVNQVSDHDFKVCDPSTPLASYVTGSDMVTLTKPDVYYFICGFPGHCDIGQKLRIVVLPASLGPVAAPVPGPVRSRSPSPSPLAESPVNNAHMGPSSAPVPSPVRSRSSSSSPSPSPLAESPVNNARQYQMGPSLAPVPGPVRSRSFSSSSSLSQMGPSPAPNSRVWIDNSPFLYSLFQT